jgi:uncharacterized protein (TIGR03437 family)
VVGRQAPNAIWAFLSTTFPVAGISTSPPIPGNRQPFSSTSAVTLASGSPTAIVRLGLNNEEVSRLPLDSPSIATFRKALVDTDGSLIVLMNTSTPGLPLVNPLFPLQIPPLPEDPLDGPPTRYGYLLKTNAAGSRIERSTLIGGAAAPGLTPHMAPGTNIHDITQDTQGNLYLTGSTSHPDFPVTPSAAKTDPRFDIQAKGAEGFLMKLGRNLDRVIYSTFLGSDEALPYDCTGLGAPLLDQSHHSAGYAVKVNTQQQAIVYASTNGKAIPATPGGYQAAQTPGAPACQNPPPVLNSPFSNTRPVSLLRFSADGGTLLTSAYLGLTGLTTLANSSGDALHLQADGSIIAALDEVRTNPGAAMRFLRLDANLSTVLAQADLATNGYPILGRRLTLQPNGSLWLSGDLWPRAVRTPFGGGPPVADPIDRIGDIPFTVLAGDDLLVRVSAHDLQPQAAYLLPNGASSAGIRATGLTVDLFSPAGGRMSIPTSGSIVPAILAVANAAGLQGKPTASPYEFLSLYGEGIGPATAVSASFSPQGDLPTLLGGVRVWLDGVAAPLLYAGNGQVNFIAPAQLANRTPGARVLLELERDGAILATVPLRTTAWDIHPFRHTSQQRAGDVIVLNQDGTVNSNTNPVQRGQAITLYLNGGGAPPDRFPAGRRVPSARPFSMLIPKMESARLVSTPGSTATATLSWPVEYLGAAPSLAAGTLQLNVRVPTNASGLLLGLVPQGTAPNIALATLQFLEPDAQPDAVPAALPVSVTVWLKP